ncbi:hypothetical protein NDU88_006223 [Pleurodeles waltl]|uniref:Myb-like domain-containing protein n=1 Tax=Pleurodeles waltl TaxID=8319 RepID=A0AAV7PI74_PLEWA|nr:hypothetical protein NDU88_006223 [Pleurodeles waltl]
MDPRCLYRPQEDDNRPGTSQEEQHKTHDREKKKRKCCFSAEEQDILVKEVTEHQDQLFVTSKLPISRTIWQQIVDKINSLAEVRRTVIECKKRWHDCKCRTKEKMARNRKAALQTGGGSPTPQEAQDHRRWSQMSSLRRSAQGFKDRTAQTTRRQRTCRDDGSPADMPVQDYPDDMDDELTNISHQTLQEVFGTLQTPPSVTRRSTDTAAIAEDPPTTQLYDLPAPIQLRTLTTLVPALREL